MKITAVLLAGGESRRMMQDKATMMVGSKPLWQQQLDLLRKLSPDEILVSARTDPRWRPDDTQFVADDPPSSGPISGLTVALKRARNSHLLALAVDMPFMTEGCLRRTCDLVEGHRGVLPMIGHRAEPLAAVYPVEVFPDFRASLSEMNFSLQSLTLRLVAGGKLTVLPVGKDEENLYRSLNQPSDIVAWNCCRTEANAGRVGLMKRWKK